MDAGEAVRLTITRFKTGYSATILERSALRRVATANGVNTFAIRLPVHGGEQIGLDVPAQDRHIPRGCYWYTGAHRDFAYVADDRRADGQVTPFTNGEGGFESSRVSVRATIDTRATPAGGPLPPIRSGCEVPQLRGLSLFRAKQALAANECGLGKVTRRRSRMRRATSTAPNPASSAMGRWRPSASFRWNETGR